jgi:hypothetical protein
MDVRQAAGIGSLGSRGVSMTTRYARGLAYPSLA